MDADPSSAAPATVQRPAVGAGADPAPVRQLASAFGDRADISARSVLVTIFGDSIVPAGGAIWLGDLIELCSPFGFSDRLVRTSMFRLTSEDWFETERVGRRSRYRLTSRAIGEFAAAEARIYHRPQVDWDGTWTLVFLGGGAGGPAEELLRWRGCAPLAPGVLASPQLDVAEVSRVIGGTDVTDVPVAEARFADLAPLVASEEFIDDFGLAEAGDRYRDFIHRYQWASAVDVEHFEGDEAFLLRTMLVHDLRRPRLADPDLPVELAPQDWPAPAAMDLAAAVYGRVAEPADRWLAGFDGLDPQPRIRGGRFS